MTHNEIVEMLEETNLPIAYDHFAEGESPDPPFICFLFPGSDNFSADGRVYLKIRNVNVELYTDLKDPELEDVQRKIDEARDAKAAYSVFATFTGNTEGRPEQITDCTDAVLTFLERFMKRPEQTEIASEADDRYIRLSEEDIPEIIAALRNQKNGEKFTSLFDDGMIPDGLSQSEADASLCAMIAFRTGPDPEMIDAIFRESALYRDKWDRADYAKATIKAGIRACKGVFHHSLRIQPDFVLTDSKGRLYVSATRLADHVGKHCTYLLVTEAQRGSYKKYVYKDGVYQLYSDDRFKGLIRQQIADYDKDLVKMSVVDEAFKKVREVL